jgi:ABC-2 type transport system permease protein
MLAGIRSRHEATALLVPFVIWSILAFVLPQIGTAARPVSLLNPVPAVNPTGGYFDFLSALTAPVAVTEQFKRAAGALLQDPAATGNAVASALGLVVFLLVMAIAITVTPRARMRRPLDD